MTTETVSPRRSVVDAARSARRRRRAIDVVAYAVRPAAATPGASPVAARVVEPVWRRDVVDERAAIILVQPEHLVRRVANDGMIGFGEAYMAGDWDAPDLEAVLEVFAVNYDDLVPRGSAWLRRWVLPSAVGRDENSPTGARRNIAHHYDLSNALFRLFLDETMTYSSAMFEASERADRASLADAQRHKIDRILDSCRVGPGTRLLEIGSGWGELALRAGQRGATVLTITLSREQQVLARDRVGAAGLADRVDVRLADYRSLRGTYDAIVSVEMIEAVGAEYWTEYFRQIDRLLAPGGRAGIQTITKPHRRMLAERKTYSWINKYVFPGGVIPSIEAIADVLASSTELRIVERHAFGRSYADTLAIWRQRFDDNAKAVTDLGFDDVFRRMWRFYLACSEAGFRTGLLDVEQLVLRRDG